MTKRGFTIKTRRFDGITEIVETYESPETSLICESTEDIGKMIYALEDGFTTIKTKGITQTVGIWESEDVLLIDLPKVESIDIDNYVVNFN